MLRRASLAIGLVAALYAVPLAYAVEVDCKTIGCEDDVPAASANNHNAAAPAGSINPVGTTTLATITNASPNLKVTKGFTGTTRFTGLSDNRVGPADPNLDLSDKFVIQGANTAGGVGFAAASFSIATLNGDPIGTIPQAALATACGITLAQARGTS